MIPAILIILTIRIIMAIRWMLLKILSVVINGQRSHKVTIPGGCCRALGLSVTTSWANWNLANSSIRYYDQNSDALANSILTNQVGYHSEFLLTTNANTKCAIVSNSITAINTTATLWLLR